MWDPNHSEGLMHLTFTKIYFFRGEGRDRCDAEVYSQPGQSETWNLWHRNLLRQVSFQINKLLIWTNLFLYNTPHDKFQYTTIHLWSFTVEKYVCPWKVETIANLVIINVFHILHLLILFILLFQLTNHMKITKASHIATGIRCNNVCMILGRYSVESTWITLRLTFISYHALSLECDVIILYMILANKASFIAYD